MEYLDAERPFDAGTYGRSFADVYDDWYPTDSTTAAAIRGIASMSPPHARILELGIGTGRLALPLAQAGYQVTGIDSSPEMLSRLTEKLALASDVVVAALGDVSDPGDWPAGPFDTIVAAFNLILNVGDPEGQRRVFDAAATALSPDGVLVIECSLPAPPDVHDDLVNVGDRGPNRHLEVREVTADSVVLIATESHPDSQSVIGQHIELRDGEPVRLRPWRIRFARPEEMDDWASSSGLQLLSRYADWIGTDFDPLGSSHVSVYRRIR